MRLDDWKQAGRTFDFGGRRIFYRDEGRGDVLLCIHGFPTASFDWVKLWPTLIQRFRVIAPDMLGFGFSDKPRRHAYSLFEQATLHEALLASLGLQRAHVLAHDYGDTVAQELLARHLDRTRTGAPGLSLHSVCFLNGGLFPEVHRALRVQKLLAGPLGSVLAAFVTRRTFQKNFAALFGPQTQPTSQELEDFWHLSSREGGTRISHRLLSYMAERRQHRERWVSALVESPVPLRVVDGAVDPISGAHMVARYRELIPRPDTVLLEGIGHYPQVEAPAAVLRAFLAFVPPALPNP